VIGEFFFLARDMEHYPLMKLACDRANEKKKSHVTARMEITRRLVSAGLKVKTVLNTTHTEIHVLVSANLERLEAEAEATGMIHIISHEYICI
jgi:hypothetical protein